MLEENKSIRKKILLTAVIKIIFLIIIIWLLLFIPAGTMLFWNAWMFIGIVFSLIITAIVYFYIKDPEFIEKRMKTREKERIQTYITKLAILPYIVGILLPGFDYRYGWSEMPVWLSITFAAIMIIGYGVIFIVMVQNRYASRIIEIQKGQKLIDTGLYSYVRHPMYSGATIIYISTPFVLGSFYALIPFLIIPVLLIIRINNEEKVLKKGLEGYLVYTEKVKYRIVPFVW